MPAFRRLLLSSIASAGALTMERTVTAWLVLEAGGGAVAVGFVFAARMLPSLLLGLAAGTLADRGERTRQLLAVGVLAMLLMAAFGLLVISSAVPVWGVVVFAFVAGCVQVFDTPARQALVLDTVPRDQAARAMATNALANRFSSAVGAIGAGGLIAWMGIGRCYVVVAALFAIGAALVTTVRVAHEHHRHVAPPPFREAFGQAARLVFDHPAVRTLILAGLACEIFAFSHMSAIPVFAQNVLRTGSEGLGTMNGAAAIGGAVAVGLLALLPGRVRGQPVLAAIFVVYGLAIIGLAFTHTLLTAALVLVVIGCCAGAFDVLQQTLIQMAVPDEQRGRAVGVWVLGIGSAPIGHLEMGFVVAALGAPQALAINGAITVAAAMLLLLRSPEYRWRAQPHSSLS